jgi:selenium metabolism protein YedF
VSNKILDARSWVCPKPVIETKKALQTVDNLTVIVDNRAARENVSRLASKTGYNVNIEEKDDGTYIHISKGSETAVNMEILKKPEPEEYMECANRKLVLLIASDTIGRGSDELGGILMRAFMHTFLEVKPRPDVIILMNNGVKLAVTGSVVLDDLKSLASDSVEIIICGTCLKYFDLIDKVAVGEISNAYTIVETLLQAGKVVRL